MSKGRDKRRKVKARQLKHLAAMVQHSEALWGNNTEVEDDAEDKPRKEKHHGQTARQ